jgi:hypothetical protein
MSTTVALIASVGLAFAQTPAPVGVPSAPAEKTAPVGAPEGTARTKSPNAVMKSGREDIAKDRKGAQAQGVQESSGRDDMKAGRPGSRGANSESKQQERSPAGMNADTRTSTDTRGSQRTLDRTGNAKSGSRDSGSRDQASAGRSENLSGEQRSTIRTVITRQNVRPMTNATFAITVGTRVPRTAHFNRVPLELVAINPRWRGFDYVLVGDQILVVNPRTHKIVAILDA